MRAWRVVEPGPVAGHPLRFESVLLPEIGPNDLLVRVLACGVCRTDLHVAEGDLPVHRAGVVPGHEVVGVVHRVGEAVEGFAGKSPIVQDLLERYLGVARPAPREPVIEGAAAPVVPITAAEKTSLRVSTGEPAAASGDR